MSEPLDTYNEVRADGKRRLQLYADRVFVKGSSTAGMTFETNIQLRDLRPDPDRLWLQSRWRLNGVLSLAVSAVSFFLLVTSSTKLAQGGNYAVIFVFGAIAVATGIFGLRLCIHSFRKYEYARFQSHAGIVLLDIANAGPDSSRFDKFVQLLSSQIRSEAGAVVRRNDPY